MKKALTAVSLIICTALICMLALCSCSKEAEKVEKPAAGGVPDRVVSRSAQSDSVTDSVTNITENTAGITSDTSVTSDSIATDSPENLQTVDTQENPEKSDDEQSDENITVEETDLSDCRAMEYLKLLNSGKVHASLIEASSHDNENASSIEREYFVNGNKAVFINGSTKIIMDDNEVTVIDTDEMTYYSYPREDEDVGANFGYDISDYTLVSRDEDSDGTLTEVYEISNGGGSIKSTWTFFPSGNLTVADVTSAGTYYWYNFDLIESDVSKMDMSIPEGVIETEPEDYFE